MNPVRRSVLLFRSWTALVLLTVCASAQSSNLSPKAAEAIARAGVAPVNRVRGPVTEAFTPLKGEVRRMPAGALDRGQLPDSTPTGRMVLWLHRSAEQQAHLGQFLNQTQNPASKNYRRWMTPDTFGAAFGVSEHDVAAVQQWLQSKGLTVEEVAAARNAVVFSGTTGALSSAFHTTIHRFSVGNQIHVSNVTEPMIPSALAPVIAGVSPMNDFHPKPLHAGMRAARFDAASGHVKPAITVNDPNGGFDLFVTPADASIIYDTPNQQYNPAAKQTLDGSGITIGIVGYSQLAMADVQNYRTAFVPTANASNLPKPVLDGGIDPGVIPGGYGVEPLLDVEIAGGLAPGAAIQYYYAASTDISDGLILASLRALDDNQVSILSVSYGQCEAELGPAGNTVWSELWEQAAAQGISVTVSTGDNGSASCDAVDADQTQATQGLAVSGIASTPYDIAVGGTDFYSLANNFGQYVNTTSKGSYPYYATSLGYIPENPWNDSSTVIGQSFTMNVPALDGLGNTDIIAGGGGLSSSAVCGGYLTDPNTCSQSLSGYSTLR